MGRAMVAVVLAVGLVVAVKGLPLIAAAIEGRRIEAAVRGRDGLRLRRALAGAAGLAELGRVLGRLPTRDLVTLGNGMVDAAETERGAQVLAAIAEVVERRDQVLERWERLRQRRQALEGASAGRAEG